jgi:hypothetical protein
MGEMRLWDRFTRWLACKLFVDCKPPTQDEMNAELKILADRIRHPWTK